MKKFTLEQKQILNAKYSFKVCPHCRFARLEEERAFCGYYALFLDKTRPNGRCSVFSICKNKKPKKKKKTQLA